MPTSEQKLIHYCAMHCQQNGSDKLYTLMVYRLDPDPSHVGGRARYEVFAIWGKRACAQKDSYKFGGEQRLRIAEEFDKKIVEQRAKGYRIVDGGPVGSQHHIWPTVSVLAYPPTTRGNLPSGSGNVGSGGVPARLSANSGPMPDYAPGPIAQAMRASRGAGSFAEALSTPVHTGRSQKDRDAEAQRQAEVNRLRAEMEDLQRRLAAADGSTAPKEAARRVTRKITLED